MTEPIKLTEEIWNDFLNGAVDASGSAGWRWFEKKHGFTCESFEKLLLQNQEIVDIVKDWAQSEPISISNGIKLTHEQRKIRHGPVYRLINLIRDKTGVNIGELS